MTAHAMRTERHHKGFDHEWVADVDFGKDHWGLLAYLETRVCDRINASGEAVWEAGDNAKEDAIRRTGTIEYRRLRVHALRHGFVLDSDTLSTMPGWNAAYGTVLKDGTRREQHDDIDCLLDLEQAGFIELDAHEQTQFRLHTLGFLTARKLARDRLEGIRRADFRADSIPPGFLEEPPRFVSDQQESPHE